MPKMAVDRPKKDPVKYSKRLCHQIHKLYLQGYSIAAIARLPGMPTANTIFQWKGEFAFFKEMMKDAKIQRAEVFEDKAITAAEDSLTKEDAPSQRLKFDAYKWAAEVNDPSHYGKKVTHAGDSSNPIKIVVSTGFPEPTEWQKHPELGPDGLIKKNVAVATLPKEET